MILYVIDTKHFTWNFLVLLNTFINMSEYKTKQLVALLYTNDKYVVKGKKYHPYNIHTHTELYLEINLTKKTKDLYSENLILMV